MLSTKLDMHVESSTWFYFLHAIIIALTGVYIAIFVKDTTYTGTGELKRTLGFREKKALYDYSGICYSKNTTQVEPFMRSLGQSRAVMHRDQFR